MRRSAGHDARPVDGSRCADRLGGQEGLATVAPERRTAPSWPRQPDPARAEATALAEGELVGLADQVDAEAVVRLLGHKLEAALQV